MWLKDSLTVTDFASSNWKYACALIVRENLKTWRGNVRKSRSSIFCFSCTSSCSFVERVKEKMWMVAVAFLIQSITFLDQGSDNAYLTRKIIIGDMMRTRRRIAIPNACCWFAVFNSLSTVSLERKRIIQKPSWFYFSKLTQVVFSVLSKRSSASLYSRMWQHSTGTGFSAQQGLNHLWKTHLKSFVCVRIFLLLI